MASNPSDRLLLANVHPKRRIRYLRDAFQLLSPALNSYITGDQTKALLISIGVEVTDNEYHAAMIDLSLEPEDFVTFERLLQILDQLSLRRQAQERAGRLPNERVRGVLLSCCIFVLFALSVAFLLVYLSSTTKSSWLLGLVIGLSVMSLLIFSWAVLVPLYMLKMKRRQRMASEAAARSAEIAIANRLTSVFQISSPHPLRPADSEFTEVHNMPTSQIPAFGRGNSTHFSPLMNDRRLSELRRVSLGGMLALPAPIEDSELKNSV